MFEALGLSKTIEVVYLALLEFPEASVDDLQRKLDLPIDSIRHALDNLARLSLLQRSRTEPNTVRAIDPLVGVEALAALRRREIEQSCTDFVLFLKEQADRAAPPEPMEGERLQGLDNIRARVRSLAEACEWEVCALMPGAQSSEALAASRTLDSEAFDRGVRLRTVYQDSIRSHPPTLEYAQWLISQGAEVRTAPTLPLRMLIVDRRIALVPVQTENTRDAAMEVTSNGMVTALLALFNSVRRDATLLGASKPRDAEDLSDRDHQVLQLLVQGHTDEAIARRLGVSVRTARRITGDLLGRLDANSRFEAGAKAVVRGWISPADLK